MALATIGYFAKQAAEARQRTEEWGAAVSKAEAKELSRFKDKVDETTKAIETFGTEGVEDVEAVKTAFSNLTDEIVERIRTERPDEFKYVDKVEPKNVSIPKKRRNKSNKTKKEENNSNDSIAETDKQ